MLLSKSERKRRRLQPLPVAVLASIPTKKKIADGIASGNVRLPLLFTILHFRPTEPFLRQLDAMIVSLKFGSKISNVRRFVLIFTVYCSVSVVFLINEFLSSIVSYEKCRSEYDFSGSGVDVFRTELWFCLYRSSSCHYAFVLEEN